MHTEGIVAKAIRANMSRISFLGELVPPNLENVYNNSKAFLIRELCECMVIKKYKKKMYTEDTYIICIG